MCMPPHADRYPIKRNDRHVHMAINNYTERNYCLTCDQILFIVFILYSLSVCDLRILQTFICLHFQVFLSLFSKVLQTPWRQFCFDVRHSHTLPHTQAHPHVTPTCLLEAELPVSMSFSTYLSHFTFTVNHSQLRGKGCGKVEMENV